MKYEPGIIDHIPFFAFAFSRFSFTLNFTILLAGFKVVVGYAETEQNLSHHYKQKVGF
ncbi:MAG: hypothetical protein IPL50_06765 [Chitinophagaceae bacterium]|nr:hypothetical protein [Chitinophagaceae bacterium]